MLPVMLAAFPLIEPPIVAENVLAPEIVSVPDRWTAAASLVLMADWSSVIASAVGRISIVSPTMRSTSVVPSIAAEMVKVSVLLAVTLRIESTEPDRLAVMISGKVDPNCEPVPLCTTRECDPCV